MNYFIYTSHQFTKCCTWTTICERIKISGQIGARRSNKPLARICYRYNYGTSGQRRLHSIEATNWFVHNILILFCFAFSSSLICYDFVSSSTLLDFLCEKGTVLNFDTVCAIACDVISAVERLQDLGILYNNITASNILIGQCPRVSKRFFLPIFFPNVW